MPECFRVRCVTATVRSYHGDEKKHSAQLECAASMSILNDVELSLRNLSSPLIPGATYLLTIQEAPDGPGDTAG